MEWGVDFKGNDVALKKGILHWEECANLCQGFMKLNLIKSISIVGTPTASSSSFPLKTEQ